MAVIVGIGQRRGSAAPRRRPRALSNGSAIVSLPSRVTRPVNPVR